MKTVNYKVNDEFVFDKFGTGVVCMVDEKSDLPVRVRFINNGQYFWINFSGDGKRYRKHSVAIYDPSKDQGVNKRLDTFQMTFQEAKNRFKQMIDVTKSDEVKIDLKNLRYIAIGAKIIKIKNKLEFNFKKNFITVDTTRRYGVNPDTNLILMLEV